MMKLRNSSNPLLVHDLVVNDFTLLITDLLTCYMVFCLNSLSSLPTHKKTATIFRCCSQSKSESHRK
jgi:hypothetical protein